ncbi:PREDICTED: gamma-tubulin complex component 2-like [Haliaeetus leucocephalus]|uniref:gamma-tubulin complex component 2-like n=1 Tax=Haliaeetus leucocephalus TaxID=52644 RepID=UPI00053CD4EC|nr:PREDICTED: gamma-tubulin complex component 2-like [Haliaeetus leucocephalus]
MLFVQVCFHLQQQNNNLLPLFLRLVELVASGGSMSEFRIHHDVNELLSLLRVHGGEGAEVYIDLLQKNRTPYVTTTVSAHSAKVKIAEFSRTPEDFLKKYDELKSKNTRHLDSLVYLLSKLTEDKETLQYLQQNAKERAELAANAATSVSTNFSIPSSTSKISLQELEELRKQLGSVTANSSVQQVLSLPKLWAQSLSLLLMCIVVFLSFII